MQRGPIDLSLPLSRRDAKRLHLGEIVTVSGRVFTGRSLFHIRGATEGRYPPLDFAKTNCFFHVGPVMRRVDSAWQVVSAEPTSSIRFERYAPKVIRDLGLRTLIGKTTMGRGSGQALKDVGGIHLSKIGLCGNELVSSIKAVEAVYGLDELGTTEATWVFQVEKFGPFFVDIDVQGRNYFEKLAKSTDEALQEALRTLGVPDGYTRTDVGPLLQAENGIRHV